MLFGDGVDDPKIYGPIGVAVGALGLLGGAGLALWDRFRESRAKWKAAELAHKIAEEKAQAELDAAADDADDRRDRKLSGQLQKIIQRLEREREACEDRTSKLEGKVQYLTEKLSDQGKELKKLEGDNADLRRALGWGTGPHTPLKDGEVTPHGPDGDGEFPLPHLPETDPA